MSGRLLAIVTSLSVMVYGVTIEGPRRAAITTRSVPAAIVTATCETMTQKPLPSLALASVRVSGGKPPAIARGKRDLTRRKQPPYITSWLMDHEMASAFKRHPAK